MRKAIARPRRSLPRAASAPGERPLPHVTDLLAQRVAALSRALDRQAEGTLARRTDMTLLESRILAYVAVYAPITMTDLAAGMFIDFGQTSRLASRLVKLGYLVRRKNAEDQRSVLLTLSPRGEVAYARMQRSVTNWNRVLMAQLQPDEFAVLDRALRRLTSFVSNYSRHDQD